jgi:hypothetical protein
VQVESEDVVFALETIVENFGGEMAPFAVGLCQHLSQAYWRLQVGHLLSYECLCCPRGALGIAQCIWSLVLQMFNPAVPRVTTPSSCSFHVQCWCHICTVSDVKAMGILTAPHGRRNQQRMTMLMMARA